MPMRAELTRYRGQVAIVSEGARGNGTAISCIPDECGVAGYVADIPDTTRTVDAIMAAGVESHGVRLDVADRKHRGDRYMRIVEQGDRIDILVAKAGICPPLDASAKGDFEQWDWAIDINVNGPQNRAAATWDPKVTCNNGRNELVSSMAFYERGAIVGITRHMARNGVQYGGLSNIVVPEVIPTDVTASVCKPDPGAIPAHHISNAGDVTGPTRFLCGLGSDYMTGSVVDVTDGIVLAA
jgi:NAD(P)-dependent dehydrogenase (short-subunit alcohol dehydrogenase family)